MIWLALVLSVAAATGQTSVRTSATLAHRYPSRERPVLSGPALTVGSPGGFLVHYTTQGQDATTHAYACSVAAWADAAAARFVSLGWLPPPADGGGGGDTRYDIYLMGLGPSLGGYTQLEEYLPGGFPDDATSFMVIATGMGDLEAMAWVAHHVHQACQYAYSANELGAWMEQCAGWIEEVAFPQADQWALRTGAYLGNCHRFLFTADGWTERGSLLWPKFLAESTDPDVVRRVWVRCAQVANNNTVSALDLELSASGMVSLATQYQTFTVWNLFTGPQDDGLHYQEGWLITGSVPFVASHSTYPAQGSSGLSAPWGLGCNYVEFLPDGKQTLALSLDCSDAHGPWGASVVVDSAGAARTVAFPLDGSWQGVLSLPGFSSVQRVVLVVQNLRYVPGTQGSYWYRATTSDPPSAPGPLAASVSGEWIQLSWAPATDPDGDLAGYRVYRATGWYVPLGQMAVVGFLVQDQDPQPGVQWTDQGVLGAQVVGDPQVNYVWVVTAVDSLGNQSAPSNRAGEFDVLLSPP